MIWIIGKKEKYRSIQVIVQFLDNSLHQCKNMFICLRICINHSLLFLSFVQIRKSLVTSIYRCVQVIVQSLDNSPTPMESNVYLSQKLYKPWYILSNSFVQIRKTNVYICIQFLNNYLHETMFIYLRICINPSAFD